MATRRPRGRGPVAIYAPAVVEAVGNKSEAALSRTFNRGEGGLMARYAQACTL